MASVVVVEDLQQICIVGVEGFAFGIGSSSRTLVAGLAQLAR